MKIFQSELVHAYNSYSFGYCNYLVSEETDSVSHIYNLGYLPYSGAQNVENIFYMARSLRVSLEGWELNSENRRINKRFLDLLERKVVPFHEFNWHDETFIQFCLDYFANRHGANIMPRERLLYILQSRLITEIVVYSHAGKDIGYVYVVTDANMAHFWYSFYDLSYANQSLGLWLMIDVLAWSQETGKNHVYLGTAYGEKGLYKTNFNNLEYWNGRDWVSNIGLLKERCRNDEDRVVTASDEWKLNISEHLFV